MMFLSKRSDEENLPNIFSNINQNHLNKPILLDNIEEVIPDEKVSNNTIEFESYSSIMQQRINKKQINTMIFEKQNHLDDLDVLRINNS
jgi:EAL domain-containing protein (putative c-di-GMP-specific phosphodiesterase class I)